MDSRVVLFQKGRAGQNFSASCPQTGRRSAAWSFGKKWPGKKSPLQHQALAGKKAD
jgi:hypothetical protein